MTHKLIKKRNRWDERVVDRTRVFSDGVKPPPYETDDPRAAFIAEMRSHDFEPPPYPAIGKLDRMPAPGDKPGKKSGWYWYVEFPDDSREGGVIAIGVFGSWRGDPEKVVWFSDRRDTLSPAAQAHLREQIKAAKVARDHAKKEAHKLAAQRAAEIWEGSGPAPANHPYLIMKGIGAHGIRVSRGNLVVPIMDGDQITSLQFIGPEGDKRFLRGGRVKGCYYRNGEKDSETVYVAEGFATAATLHEITGDTCYAAFNAGNILEVGRAIRTRHPDAQLVIAGDDDHATDDNPGRAKAVAAANALGCKVVFPKFGEGAGPDDTDFNDMARLRGAEAVRSIVEAAELIDAAPIAEDDADLVDTGKPMAKASVPYPFKLTKTAVTCKDDEKGEMSFVCSHLEVTAVTRNAAGTDWGRQLRLRDGDGIEKEWPMPMELLAGGGDEYRRVLLSMGLVIAPGQKARNRLHQYISTCRPRDRVRCVNRIGWHGRVFVLPDETIGNSQGERVLLQTVGPLDHAFRSKGTLEDWRKNVAQCAIGNSRLVFSISAAFAALLLHLVEAESGGFHLRGLSSIGKTTALEVAGSVWGGGGLKGYIRQWRATDNGLEAVAQAHCDSLLCLDELSQIDGRAAGASAYMLANGAGKSRAGRAGEARSTAEWRVLFLSTGEIGIADKVAEDGRGRKITAGQQVRVIDIPADAGAGFGLFDNHNGFESADPFAQHLRQAANKYHGTAARAFLAKVTAEIDDVRRAVVGFIDEFVKQYCPSGADGQVSRVVRRFALVAAAGELATDFGIVPWESGEAKEAVGTCFGSWLEARGGGEPAEVTAGIAQVRLFIEMHGESRFTPWGEAESNRPTVNRAGFRKPDADRSTEYYVLPEVWRSEVCKGFDSGMIARTLEARGLLIPGNDSKRASTHKPPGLKAMRLYRLASSILESDGHA